MEQISDASAMVALAPVPVWTVGPIARHATAVIGDSVSAFDVDYVIRSRGVHPVARAGHLKIFDQEAVEFIVSELAAIRAEREGGAE